MLPPGYRRSGLPTPARPLSDVPLWNGQLAKQYGMPLPLVYGTARVPGKTLWLGPVTDAPDLQIRDTTMSPTGWKAGPGKVAPALIALCEGAISMVLRAWRWGDCVAALRWLSRPIESGAAITVLLGDGTEGTWALQTGLTTKDESYSIASEATSFTVPDAGTLYTASPNQGAKRMLGAGDWNPMTLVGSAPAAGQYTYAAGVYGFASGDVHPKMVTVRRDLTLLGAWLYPMRYQNTAQVRFDALGVSEGQLPNYGFEVVGPCASITDPRGSAATYGVDCHPADVLLDLLTHTRRGLGWSSSQVEVDLGPDGTSASGFRTWCTAMGFVVSRAIMERVATSQLVEELLEACWASAAWSEGKLKVIPLGETTVGSYTPPALVATLGPDDFIVERGRDPVQVTRVLPSQTYTVHPVTFTDRNAHYSDVTLEVPLDDPFVSATAAYTGYEQPPKARRADAKSFPWISTPAHAAKISWLRAMRSLYVRNTFRFVLGPRWPRLEPGDLLAITDPILGLTAQQVRVTSIEERVDEKGNSAYEIRAEEAPFSTATPPTLTVQTADGLASSTPAPVQTLPGGRIDDGTVTNPKQNFMKAVHAGPTYPSTDFTVTFTNAEPDTSYDVTLSYQGSIGTPAYSFGQVWILSKSTTGFTCRANPAPGGVNVFPDFLCLVTGLRNGG